MYKVFIADDEPYILDGLKLLIDWEAMGLEIAGSAEDGESAYEEIKRLKPDIVITDIRMPGLSGLELVKKCKDVLREAPEFLMLTGYGDLEYIKKAMRFGARGYLMKPINTEELNKHLEMILSELAERNDDDSELDESISYVVRDTFISIFYGNCTEKLVNRAAFIIGLNDKESEVSVILFSLQRGLSREETERIMHSIRAARGINPVCVFYAGFSHAAYISPRIDESMCLSIAQSIRDKLITDIMILRPTTLYCLPRVFMKTIREHPQGVSVSRICNMYNSIDTEFDDMVINVAINKLIELIESNDWETAEFLIRRALERVSDNDRSVHRSRGVGMSFMFEMYKCVQRLGMECEELFNEYSYKMSNASYISEMGDICIELLVKVSEQINGEKSVSDFKSVMDYIESRYKSNITLKDIAKDIYIKPSLVSKIVKSSTGMKFCDYLNELRMREACRLLAQTDMSISNIVSEVGYKDYAYFANKFRQFIGLLPSQYRKQVQQKL